MGEKKKTSIKLDEDLFILFKAKVCLAKKTISQVLEEFIKEYLKKD